MASSAEQGVGENDKINLPPNPTMRDINDLCASIGIPSLAQGMIELPPPIPLVDATKTVSSGNVHVYRNRCSCGVL